MRSFASKSLQIRGVTLFFNFLSPKQKFAFYWPLQAEPVAENGVSEDISPAKTRCGKCEYTTEMEIPEDSSVAEQQQQLKFHL